MTAMFYHTNFRCETLLIYKVLERNIFKEFRSGVVCIVDGKMGYGAFLIIVYLIYLFIKIG